MPSFDDIRARLPHLGFAVYAYAPDGPVTLEVLLPDGKTFTQGAESLEAALLRAFPAAEPEPDPFG